MTDVDNLLLHLVKENKSPSVQYTFFDKDQIIHNVQTGFADIKNQKKISGNTTYNAYSVTKTFTALAILQLAEKGKLEIEQSAKKYMPEFPYSPEITVKELLTHSAGIPNPIPLSWVHLPREHATFDRDQFFNQQFLKHNKTAFRPNEKFAYSNLGYVLLGQLIEKVSGIPYEEYITEQIIKPLGLHTNELRFSFIDNGQHAKGYHKRFSFSNLLLPFLIDKAKLMSQSEGKWNVFNAFYVNGNSYGGLFGTTNAFVRYLQELLKPDCKLLSSPFIKMLFTENYTIRNKATGMCLSWFCGQLKGNKYFTHAGGGGGFYCELRIYPDIGVGSVIMFNRTGMTDERFLDNPDNYFIHEKKVSR